METDELVRGYEYERGKYLPLTEEDFDKVEVESRAILPISAFVEPSEIDSVYFDKLYYFVPEEKEGKRKRALTA